jgi:hypothetical protein
VFTNANNKLPYGRDKLGTGKKAKSYTLTKDNNHFDTNEMIESVGNRSSPQLFSATKLVDECADKDEEIVQE